MGLTPSFRRPNFIPPGDAKSSVVSAIQSHDNSITDLNQAIASLKTQVNTLKTGSSASTATSTTTQVSTEDVTNTTVSGGTVNNQSGNTVYTTAQSDNGALIILDDASPVAVTLNNSVTTPYYCFIYNGGAGLVTLTPQQGQINSGSTEEITTGLFSIVFFDGMNWWAAALPLVPETFTPILHEFLTGYNAATGSFSAGQPAFTDISGVAATNQIGTGTPASGDYVDGGTGAWTPLPSTPSLTKLFNTRTNVTSSITYGGAGRSNTTSYAMRVDVMGQIGGTGGTQVATISGSIVAQSSATPASAAMATTYMSFIAEPGETYTLTTDTLTLFAVIEYTTV